MVLVAVSLLANAWAPANMCETTYIAGGRQAQVMPSVKLSLSVPEDTWIGSVSRAYPAATFRVLTAMVSDGTGFGVLEIATETPLEILADVEEDPDLDRLDLISAAPDRTIVHIETGETTLLDPLTAAGIPLETPVRIEDGTVVWTFTAPEHRLSTLDASLRAAGFDYEVEYVRTGTAPNGFDGPDLTDRQAEVFETAYRLGFFEIPREATVAEVAGATGVSKSTASDVIRRATRNIAEWYVPDEQQVQG